MRLAALLLLAGAATAANDCIVLDAPGASSIEARSLDGTLMGNGTEVCLPDAHYRITLEAATCPQLTCLVPTAVPTPTPSAEPAPAPAPGVSSVPAADAASASGGSNRSAADASQGPSDEAAGSDAPQPGAAKPKESLGEDWSDEEEVPPLL